MTGLSEKVKCSFDLKDCLEFTVEAGRPDSITREKLMALKKKRHQPYISQSTDYEAADTGYNRKTPHGRRYDK